MKWLFMTAGFPMDPRVGDATEEMRSLMDLKCAQPNNTNIVRNARGESWLGPSSWEWGLGDGDDDGLMLERAWDTAEAPASLQETAFICVIFSPSCFLAWFLPPFSLGAWKQQIQILNLQTGCSGWRIIPVHVKKVWRDEKNERRVRYER